MTPAEANAVLAYCAAADTRFTTADEDQARARAQVWADLLGDVEPQFALDHVRRFYAHHHDWSIQPGAIRDAWRNHQRVVEAKARHTALLAREEPAEAVASEAQVAAREALREALAVPRPAPTRGKIAVRVREDLFSGGAGHGQ